MKISLLLATRNRNQDLRRFLLALSDQEYLNYELIVVDQSERKVVEKNRKAIAKFIYSEKVRHVVSQSVGLSKARNIGMAFVSGDIVSFPDDDCWYSKELLAKVKRVFSLNGNLDFISGNYTEPGVVNKKFPNFDRKILPSDSVRAFSSITLFISLRRISDRKVLYFDENIGAGTALPSGEELDLVLRILKNGYNGSYFKDITIFHKIERDSIGMNAQVIREKSHGYVYAKNSDSLLVSLRLLAGAAKLLALCLFTQNGVSRLTARFSGIRAGLRQKARRVSGAS